MLFRAPQRQGSFTAGNPASGYYNDLTMKASDAGSPDAAAAHARVLTADRARANPVSVAQLGLGAWQLSSGDPRWLDTVDVVVSWVVDVIEPDGTVPYRFSMPHTFPLRAPWPSAMAQGQVASLLARSASSLDRPELLEHALRAAAPLLDHESRLVAVTPEGPVLQEYPTDPPAHVLNGWMFALWGLYDVGIVCNDDRAAAAFRAGVDALAARLRLYDTPWRWSRYDLYPHRLVHVTSPFYHRLHVAQLRATAALADAQPLADTAARWSSGARNPLAVGLGLTRKVAFRVLEPRRPLP